MSARVANVPAPRAKLVGISVGVDGRALGTSVENGHRCPLSVLAAAWASGQQYVETRGLATLLCCGSSGVLAVLGHVPTLRPAARAPLEIGWNSAADKSESSGFQRDSSVAIAT